MSRPALRLEKGQLQRRDYRLSPNPFRESRFPWLLVLLGAVTVAGVAWVIAFAVVVKS
jgi:hypothetical protein